LSNAREQTVVARLRSDERTARRLADLFAECFDPDETASAVYEANGGWTVALYSACPFDQDELRQLVATATTKAVAGGLSFDTIDETDWVAASLQGLNPVAAGRFVVHGRHDRARVAVNRIGVEIEAALAFGTGHHGTTRGCLLALDRLIKARRPRGILDVGTGSGVLAIAAAVRCSRATSIGAPSRLLRRTRVRTGLFRSSMRSSRMGFSIGGFARAPLTTSCSPTSCSIRSSALRRRWRGLPLRAV